MMKVSGIKQARVLFQDSRMIEGFILKCDLYMNTVVSNSYEYRLNKNTNKFYGDGSAGFTTNPLDSKTSSTGTETFIKNIAT